MASPGAMARLDFLAPGRSSLDALYRAGSISSVPEQVVEGITLPLGAPPEPSSLIATDVLSAAAAAADSCEAGTLTEPLLSADGSERLTKDDPGSAVDAARRLCKLAFPMMLQSIAAMMLTFISTTFVGHLNDPLALSAVVLSSSLYNILGMSITIGLASAMDTLCGQAFGAKHYKSLGEVQQRARVICWTCCIPIALSWTFSEPLLVYLGQEKKLSYLAARNLHILIPSLFLGVVNDTTRRYLVSQRVVFPVSCCYLITTALSPAYNWLFIFRLNLRVEGAACAILCCTATNCFLLSCYQLYRDGYKLKGHPHATWGGYTLRAFRGWGSYLALGLPAAAMICLEWWVWELMIFMAGLLPDAATAVGVMGLAIQITNPCYMIPSSFGSATAIRVANLLGAGYALQARTTARVSSVVVLICTVVLGGATFSARHLVVRVFTEDMAIRQATAVVVPAVAAALIGDGMVAVLSSVLRASGRQAVGAVFNIAGYWGVCLPLAWLLGFYFQLGVLGFWIALSICTAFQAVAFGILISRFDWYNEVRRARALTLAHHRAYAEQ